MCIAGNGAIQIDPTSMAMSGQKAFRALISVSYSGLGLPTSKKADGFAETQQGLTPPPVLLRDGKSTFHRALKHQRKGPQYELFFLPSEDICLCSSILFYNKTPLILDVDSRSHFFYIILNVCCMWPVRSSQERDPIKGHGSCDGSIGVSKASHPLWLWRMSLGPLSSSKMICY